MIRSMLHRFVPVALTLFFLAGCGGIGPSTVERDRFDYVNALSNSWKKQMLLNLVKMRYVDAPVFLDVASVISQYQVEGRIDLSASWSDGLQGNTQTLGGSGKYADRPTITYSPLTGDKFTRSMMTPIPLQAFLVLIETDYPVDFMFRIVVQSINGIDNRVGSKMMGGSHDPNFYRLIEALRRIQRSGGLGFRIKPVGKEEAMVLLFRREISSEVDKDLAVVRELLGLRPDLHEIRIVHGGFVANDREIAILTRSMFQILVDISSYIDVPEKDIQEGRVAMASDATLPGILPLINIRSGASQPKDALVAVPYRDYWFWIDDTDVASKRVFSFMMLLFSLTETGAKTGAPIVTVPTN